MKKKKHVDPYMSEINPVSLHRAYGKKKRESIFTILNEILAMIIGFAVLGLCLFIIGIGVFFILYSLQELGVVILFLVVLTIMHFTAFRPFRKRIVFLSKLKKCCRKFGYIIEKKRGVLRGLAFNKEGFDLIVSAPYARWYVRFLTPRRHASHITILDENTLEIKTNLYSNRWKALLGLDKVRIKNIAYSFNDEVKDSGINIKKVLLVNPVPRDMFKKDGAAVIPIGTGERLYDYVIFSGSRFINELQREYEKI